MHKLILGAALTAVIAIPGALYSSSEAEGGYRKHRWGDRDWEIVRWRNGDCKIWRDDGGPPWGAERRDWTVVAANLRSYDQAWREIADMTWLESLALVVVASWNIVSYAPLFVAALPGLSIWRAIKVSQASTRTVT